MGENATVDDRLLRLFHVLSERKKLPRGGQRFAVEVLGAMNEVGRERRTTSEAAALAASFRGSCRACYAASCNVL